MVTQERDLLTGDEVLRDLNVSRATLYRLIAAHGFPKPIKIGGTTNRWYGNEVSQWLTERPRAQIHAD